MSKRILLVDDEPLLLKGLRFTLEQEGYETLTANDGEEALTLFYENPVMFRRKRGEIAAPRGLLCGPGFAGMELSRTNW